MLDTVFEPEKLQPLLIIISGPSGVGKDAVIQKMREIGVPFYFVVTVNTRKARPEEKEGVDYYFVSLEDFEQMKDRGEFLEWSPVYEEFKGTLRRTVQKGLECGIDVVLRVDVQGAAKIRNELKDTLLIFLTAESEEILIERIKKRGDSDETLQNRKAKVQEEMARIGEFDYVVLNRQNRIGKTAKTIQSIILAEHHKTALRKIEL